MPDNQSKSASVQFKLYEKVKQTNCNKYNVNYHFKLEISAEKLTASVLVAATKRLHAKH